jgi:hypothetical protein
MILACIIFACITPFLFTHIWFIASGISVIEFHLFNGVNPFFKGKKRYSEILEYQNYMNKKKGKKSF